jgi:tRNA(fMet)-specific endonuclease VapC
MIPDDALVLLDTGIVVHLIRYSSLGQRIDSQYGLSDRQVRPLVSIVTVGELAAFAEKRGWGERKRMALLDLVRELTVVDISSGEVIDRYAKIDALSEKQGRQMGKNDLWIAATAAATGAWLLTTDKDYDHLHPDTIHREWIDPDTE